MTDNLEIECTDCQGHGWRLIPGTLDDAAHCPSCHGAGWRPMTDEERDDASANAFSDMCEGEPPVTLDEQHRAAWAQKQELKR